MKTVEEIMSEYPWDTWFWICVENNGVPVAMEYDYRMGCDNRKVKAIEEDNGDIILHLE